MNKVLLFGNLTRDPELKSLPSGISVASFGMATNRRVKKGEAWESVPEFHNVVVFGRQAETTAQYLKKGSSALIDGRIQTRSWEDKAGRGKQYRTEVVAERIEFGSKGSGGASSPQTAPGAAAPSKAEGKEDVIDYPEEDINPDDIPF